MDRATVSDQDRVRLAVGLAPAPPKRGRAAREYAQLRVRVALTDVLTVEAALLLAWWLTQGFSSLPDNLYLVLLIMPLITLSGVRGVSAVQPVRISPAEEFRRLLAAVSVSWAGLLIIAFWLDRTLKRPFIALVYGLTILLAMVTRRLWHVWMGGPAAGATWCSGP